MLEWPKRIKLFWFRHNPVELPGAESKVESLLPRLEDVRRGNAEPMKQKEVRKRADEELEISKSTASNKLTILKNKGVAEKKKDSGWVSLGRTKPVLDERRVAGTMIFLAICLFFANSFLLEKLLTAFGFVFVALALLFWPFELGEEEEEE